MQQLNNSANLISIKRQIKLFVINEWNHHLSSFLPLIEESRTEVETQEKKGFATCSLGFYYTNFRKLCNDILFFPLPLLGRNCILQLILFHEFENLIKKSKFIKSGGAFGKTGGWYCQPDK